LGVEKAFFFISFPRAAFIFTQVCGKTVIPAGIAGPAERVANPDYMDVFKLAIHGIGYS